MKIRMHKRLILGLAMALVFVGGAFTNASAQCLSCQPRAYQPQCFGNCVAIQPPAQATCQGAYSFGPTTPTPFGTTGGAGG